MKLKYIICTLSFCLMLVGSGCSSKNTDSVIVNNKIQSTAMSISELNPLSTEPIITEEVSNTIEETIVENNVIKNEEIENDNDNDRSNIVENILFIEKVEGLYNLDVVINDNLQFSEFYKITTSEDIKNIKIMQIIFDENYENSIPGEIYFEKDYLDAGESIGIRTIIPEIIPDTIITYEKDGVGYSFVLAYNGRDDNDAVLTPYSVAFINPALENIPNVYKCESKTIYYFDLNNDGAYEKIYYTYIDGYIEYQNEFDDGGTWHKPTCRLFIDDRMVFDSNSTTTKFNEAVDFFEIIDLDENDGYLDIVLRSTNDDNSSIILLNRYVNDKFTNYSSLSGIFSTYIEIEDYTLSLLTTDSYKYYKLKNGKIIEVKNKE